MEGLSLVYKVGDVEGFSQPVSIYHVNPELQIEELKSHYIIGGRQKSIGFLDRQVFFLCDVNGELLFYIPVIDVEAVSDIDAFKSEGYTLVN